MSPAGYNPNPKDEGPQIDISQKDYKADKMKTMDTVIALYDFTGTQRSHLSLNIGDMVQVLTKSDTGWWDGCLRLPDGTLARGWFPYTYVRSVNFVQPILNQLKSNKEIDSLTAANTAANVLIPSFATLLKKNLSQENDSPSTSRKNSVVSFASSDEGPFDRIERRKSVPQVPTSLKENEVSRLPRVDPENISLVQDSVAQEVEQEYNSSHPSQVLWQARVSTTGERIYYSAELGIYCSEPPSRRNTEEDEHFNDQSIEADSRSGSGISHYDHNSTFMSEGQDFKKLEDEYDPKKRDSNVSSLNSCSTTASTYHHFSQPLFVSDDMFINSLEDFKTWTDLEHHFQSNISGCLRALRDFDRPQFVIFFERLNRHLAAIFLTTKLIQGDFSKTKFEKSIKRKLRRLNRSFSQIFINSALYLSVMKWSNEDAIKKSVFNFDVKKVSGYNKHVADNIIKEKKIRKGYSETSKNDLDDKLEDPAEIWGLYLQQLEADFNDLSNDAKEICTICSHLSKDKEIKRSDYVASEGLQDTPVGRYDLLPQYRIRFFKDEFNGGNWCNPFFSNPESILNASGNELKNKFHQKVIIDQDVIRQLEKYLKDMGKLCLDISSLLDVSMQHLYYNDTLKHNRNIQILRNMYKYLYFASKFVDTLESLDFTIFCLVRKEITDEDVSITPDLKKQTDLLGNESKLFFDYPIVLKFFKFKQRFHDNISRIVISAQAITLDDPDVFKGISNNIENFTNFTLGSFLDNIANDLYEKVTDRLLSSKGDYVAVNTDELLLKHIRFSISDSKAISAILRRLVDERETIINYATRVMHNDLNVQLLLMERNDTVTTDKSDDIDPFYGDIAHSDDVPWYLEADDEHDLLLDIKGNIKGGTKEALVAHLTSHIYYNERYRDEFLLMFPTLMTFGELVVYLINRFNIEAPEGLSYEEYNRWTAEKQVPIRNNVLAVFELLFENYWIDSFSKESTLKRLSFFLQMPHVRTYSASSTILKFVLFYMKHIPVTKTSNSSVSSSKRSLPIFKLGPLKKLHLSDIEFSEFARQLTLLESHLYFQITKQACICKVWGEHSGIQEPVDSITEFIKSSNQLTNFVVFMILRKEDIRKRIYVVTYFIQVAEKCRQINNYSCMTAIISALYSSPIHRLRKTWNLVPKEALDNLRRMNQLMNSTRNFNEYRDLLKVIGTKPCLPFFGLYLSDLTFIYHGNPNYLPNNPRMLNFSKRSKTYKVLEDFERLKSSFFYDYTQIPEIQNYLITWFEKAPPIEKQYQISLVLEPRTNNPIDNKSAPLL